MERFIEYVGGGKPKNQKEERVCAVLRKYDRIILRTNEQEDLLVKRVKSIVADLNQLYPRTREIKVETYLRYIENGFDNIYIMNRSDTVCSLRLTLVKGELGENI